MTGAQQMSAQDALWLTMDRPNNLMVIDVAIVLDGLLSAEHLRSAFADLVERHPVFRRRPERRSTSWWWVDDKDFDLERHVEIVDLPEPIGMPAIQQRVAAGRSRPMDRDRPMWTSELVSPVALSGGITGSVVITRFHHAIADGVRLTEVLLGMLAPTSTDPVPIVARNGTSGGSVLSVDALRSSAAEAVRVTASTTRTVAGSVGGVVVRPWQVLSGTAAAVAASLGVVRHPDRFVDAMQVLGADDHRSVNDATSVGKLLLGSSDRTVWTGRPGTDKAVAWSESIPLPWIKDVARGQGATVNDVLVAALAGGLRAYLAGRGDDVDEVLWMVPVNLKPFDGELPEELGNHFALVMLDMPLTGATWADRVHDLRHRMLRVKNSDEPILTFGLQRAISMTPRAVATFVTNFFANKAVGVLTNVPGPRSELVFGDVPMRQIIGFAPCSGDQPLTATIFTYNDTVTVGFASDADLIPDPQTIVALVCAEIDDMRAGAAEDARRDHG